MVAYLNLANRFALWAERAELAGRIEKASEYRTLSAYWTRLAEGAR